MRDDRMVHATLSDGGQVVRYERAGKWYVEYDPASLRPCRPVTIGEAVRLARAVGTYVYLGKPGGRRFDAAMRSAA